MGRFYSACIAVLVSMGSFLFGYDNGVMTDVIDSSNFLQYFHTTETSAIIGAINSVDSGGAMIGALQGGLTVDLFGRRRTIQMGALTCLIGATIQAAAQNLAMILVGRILAGWGVGIMSMAIPVYQAEFAHPRSRGLVVGLTQQMIGVGSVISTWVGYGSLHAPSTSEFQWRFSLAAQVIPAVILIIGMIFVPESPRHLIEKKEYTEAMRVLRKLHYDGTNDDWIQTEYRSICRTIELDSHVYRSQMAHANAVCLYCFTQTVSPHIQLETYDYRHGLAVQVFTQMTGINVISYYQTIMFNNLGITGSRNTLVVGIYNCVGPITNFIFVMFRLDRVG
ncbi:hypothetical protein N7488_001359 [Penicillium malachiteum]|nr:hypothetical protein N7488_001359 [Penicillium malachiteum]